jgi:hypothetical protein
MKILEQIYQCDAIFRAAHLQKFPRAFGNLATLIFNACYVVVLPPSMGMVGTS